MQLEDPLGAGPLVEAVNVLRDHGRQLPGPLEVGHEPVRRVGGHALAGVLLGEPLPVGLRVHGEEVDGQDLLQGDLPILVVEALGAPEVGDPRLGRDPGAAEEDDAAGVFDPLGEQAPLAVLAIHALHPNAGDQSCTRGAGRGAIRDTCSGHRQEWTASR